MALKTANELTDNELEAVAGGLQKTNIWGDCSKFKIGMNHTGYAYTYDANRDSDVRRVLGNLKFDSSQSEEEIERIKLDALLAESGLLTPIEGCDPSWY